MSAAAALRPALAPAARSERWWARFALWSATGVALLAVVLLGAASTAAWVAVDCLLWLALSVLVLGATHAGIRLPWNPILWPALAFGALVCWQWAGRASAYPAATLTGLLQLSGCGAMLYLALVAFQRPGNLRRLGTVFWWFAGALGAEALFQFFTSRTEIYGFRDASYATPVGPYIYHNHFAGCMELVLPAAVLVAFQVRRRSGDVLWMAWVRRGILPGLGLAAVIISQSRGGLFALLVEGGAAVALFWRVFARSGRRRRTVAIAAAALIARKVDAEWLRAVRRFALAAWLFLGIGVVLGAFWSYSELGWGGYWGWDPVENAALMPWLICTAFIHSLMIQEKRGMLKVWNVSLGLATGTLAIMGTFLVRSGILNSIHSFSAQTLGAPFVGLIGVLIAGSIYLVLSRRKMLRSEHRLDSLISRESIFVLANMVLVGLCFVIFWGTYFPLISEALTGHQASVAAPWFDRYTAPLAIIVVVLSGIGPLMAWRRPWRRCGATGGWPSATSRSARARSPTRARACGSGSVPTDAGTRSPEPGTGGGPRPVPRRQPARPGRRLCAPAPADSGSRSLPA